MDTDPGAVRAQQYDLALNGWESGGGSVRIHQRDLLEKAFALMGHTIEGMRDQFGALLDALEYGAPPHGGIAIGLDRWAALFAEVDNIREVMAFPKTQSGADLMMGAPSPIAPAQLDELRLRSSRPTEPRDLPDAHDVRRSRVDAAESVRCAPDEAPAADLTGRRPDRPGCAPGAHLSRTARLILGRQVAPIGVVRLAARSAPG